MAAELAPGIRVNAVCPGLVDTPIMAQELLTAPGAEPITGRYAMGRDAHPDEIANAILFLAGPESSFVTGSTLAVDGGRTFH